MDKANLTMSKSFREKMIIEIKVLLHKDWD